MFIIAQVANYSDFVWNEQSKTAVYTYLESITNTSAEPGLGREAERCMRSQPAAAAVFILAQVIMSGMNNLKTLPLKTLPLHYKHFCRARLR